MKKIVLLIFGTLLLSSCLNKDDIPNHKYEYIPIESVVKSPTSFTLGKIDSITLKYRFPNGCYAFDRLYYEYQDSTRVVAITAFVQLDKPCTLAIEEKTHTFAVKAMQKEDYLFKLYKGKDSEGKNIFEELVIPVN